MPLATLTSKGQVTIPKSIRSQLRLHSGDQLDFVVHDDGTITLRKRALRVDDVFGAFADRATRPISVEELDEVISAKTISRAR